MIPHDSNNTATKGNMCWGPRTKFLKLKCSTCPDLCQLTSARNVEPESVDFPPRNGGGGGGWKIMDRSWARTSTIYPHFLVVLAKHTSRYACRIILLVPDKNLTSQTPFPSAGCQFTFWGGKSPPTFFYLEITNLVLEIFDSHPIASNCRGYWGPAYMGSATTPPFGPRSHTTAQGVKFGVKS